MQEQELLDSSIALMQKHFDLSVSGNGQIKDVDQLFEVLHFEVKRMMDADFNSLLNVLYRVDVGEMQVKKILSMGDPTQVSSNLTKAIIARYREKAITRNKYSS